MKANFDFPFASGRDSRLVSNALRGVRASLARYADPSDGQIHRSLRIEHQQQPVLQLVDSANDFPRRRIEVLRRPLVGRGIHIQHVADLVHQQTHGAIVGADHHVGGHLVPGRGGKPQPPPHIDGGDDLAAQVDQPLDDLRRLGHAGHLLEAQHLLHAKNVHAEEQVGDEKRGELPAGLRQFGLRLAVSVVMVISPLPRRPARFRRPRARGQPRHRLEHGLAVELRLAILEIRRSTAA